MKQYIDKTAVVAEIEKRRSEWLYGSSIEAKYKKEECDDILSFLNTIEVKEVDLEHEIEKVKKMQSSFELKIDSIIEFCAKHFFELGLKAKKGGEDGIQQ